MSALVDDAFDRSIATGTGHIGLRTGGAAATRGRDTGAQDALLQQTHFRVGNDFERAVEFFHFFLVLCPRAIVAYSFDIIGDYRTLRRQLVVDQRFQRQPGRSRPAGEVDLDD